MARTALLVPFFLLLVACGSDGPPPLAVSMLEPAGDRRVALAARVDLVIEVTSPGGAADVEVVATHAGTEHPVATRVLASGEHVIVWQTAGLSPGTYGFVVSASEGDQSITRVPDAAITIDAPPTVRVLTPEEEEAPSTVATIAYVDDDPDGRAETTIYADADGDLATSDDRVLVRAALEHGDGSQQTAAWALDAAPPGVYTIVAVIDDGVNPPVSDASTGRIVVLGGLATTTTGVSGINLLDPGSFWNDEAMDVATFADGSYVIAGHFSGEAVWGEGSPTETRVVAAGEQDIYVARYDAMGALRWVRTAGGDGPDTACGVAAYEDGSCVVVGGVQDGARFGPGEQALGDHAFFARYTADGTLAWMHSASTSRGAATCVAPLPDGGFVAGGWAYRGIRFDWDNTPTRIILEPVHDTSYLDGFLARFGADGRIVWGRLMEGTGTAQVRGVTVLQDGSLVATGYFETAAVFNQGESETATLTSPWSSPNLVPRCFVGGWDADGGLAWINGVEGPGQSRGWEVAPHPEGGCVLLGTFGSMGADNHALLDTFRLEARVGQFVGFLARYDEEGAVAWAHLTGPDDFSSTSGRPSALAVLPGDRFAVSGWFGGRQTFGSERVRAVGDYDMYVARYDAAGQLEAYDILSGAGTDQAWNIATAPQGWVLLVGSYDETLTLPSGTLPPANGSPKLAIVRLRAE